MGGKTSTSTQQVSIPPDVLARYNSVNAQAQQTASQPFQTYSGQFVAPVNETQQAGIGQTAANANSAQPYFGAATSQLENAQNAAQGYYGAAGAGLGAAQQTGAGYNNAATALTTQAANPINAQPLDVGQYMSPYLQNVVGSQEALLNLQNQQQMSGELGNVIQSGAFGGDRAGIDLANLSTQQSLANNAILSSALNQGYNTALGAAQQQQGVNLGAAQANRAALQTAGSQLAGIGNQAFTQGLGSAQAQEQLGQNIYGTGANTAAQLAGLGTGAQSAALSGAQAELGAGQVAQQTQQAQDTALYNQFLQQQSYPFQVDQFLANIAEGTGALSGSTTTTTQPGGLFSDERLKENIREVGRLHDGQKVYAYNYKGDPTTHVGLLAQEVEGKHPEAVGLAGGYKTVDYDKATAGAARPARQSGGLVPANDRGEYAEGGAPGYDPQLMSAILSNSAGMYGPYMAALGGGSAAGVGGSPHGGAGRVPAGNLPVGHLQTAGGLPQHQSGLQSMNQAAEAGKNIATLGKTIADHLQQQPQQLHADQPVAVDTSGLSGGADVRPQPLDASGLQTDTGFRRGGRIRRYAGGGLAHYDDGGEVDPYDGGLAGPHLDIPEERSDAKLATPGQLPGGGGAGSTGQDMQDIKNAAQTAQSIAQIAAMFAKRGGRIGRADGGETDDDSMVDFATPTDGGDGSYAPEPIHYANGEIARDATSGKPVYPNSDFAAAQRAGKGLDAGSGAMTPAQRAKATTEAFGAPGETATTGPAAPPPTTGQRLAIDAARRAASGAPPSGPVPKITHPAQAAAPAPAHSQPQSAVAPIYDTSDKYDIVPPYKGGLLNPALYDNTPHKTAAGETLRALNNAGLFGEHAIYSGVGAVANGLNHYFNAPLDTQQASKGPGLVSTAQAQPAPQKGLAPAQQTAAAFGPGAHTAPQPAHPHHAQAQAAPPQPPGLYPENGGLDLDKIARGPSPTPQPAPQPAAAPAAAAPAPHGYSDADRAGMDGLVQANSTPPQSAMQRGLGAAGKIGRNVLGSAGNWLENGPIGGYGKSLAKGDPATWASLMSGLAAFGAAPTRNFGVALTQGLGGGAQGYLGAREALAGSNLEQQRADVERLGMLTHNYAQEGTAVVPGPAAPGGKTITYGGQPYHVEFKANLLPGGGGAGNRATIGQLVGSGAPGSSAFQPRQDGTYDVTPTAETSAAMMQQVGLRPDMLPEVAQGNVQSRFGPNGLTERAQQDARQAQEQLGNYGYSQQTQRQLLDLATQVNLLKDGDLSGSGAGSPERAGLVNIYRTLMQMTGHEPSPEELQNLSAHQIIEKLNTFQGASLADQAHQYSAHIADQFHNVLPSGSLTKSAANNILSGQLVQNQMARDFQAYRSHWIGMGVGDLGVMAAFNRDVGSHYQQEQQELAALMSANPGKSPEQLRQLAQHLATAGYVGADGQIHKVSAGLARYFQ